MVAEQTRLSRSCEAAAELLPAAALDVLEPREQETLQRHLSECLACTWELGELRIAATHLASAAPLATPARELKERVLAAAIQARPAGRRVLPFPVRVQRLAGEARTAWLAAAALLVVAGGAFAWGSALQTEMRSLEVRAERYDRVVGVLASERLTIRSLEPASADFRARGTVYLDPESRNGMVMIHDLPPLPAGRAWQLWYTRGTERMSGGVLRVGADGSGYTIVRSPGDLESWDGVGITEEPADGSPGPTTARIVGTRL